MDKQDIESNRFIAALSYWGILLLVPLFLKRESKFARYHANQGLVLFMTVILFELACRAVMVLLGVTPDLTVFIVGVITILNIFFLVLQILGTYRALKGELIPLPVIGQFQVLK